MLFLCESARELWSALGLSDIILDSSQVDRAGSAILEHLLGRAEASIPGISDIGLKETIVVACWYIWWIRRRRTNNETVPPIHKCKISILSITANAAKAQKHASASLVSKWSCPDPRQLKLNVDASFFLDDRARATGAVIRDFQGNFIAANCRFLPHVASAEMAEAMAMKEGLALAASLGCSVNHAESDSSDTIEACIGTDTWWSQSEAIYADCTDLATEIGEVKFSPISREANKVAHELARQCFIDKADCNWVDEPPSFVLGSFINDVTL
jgi:ribonuclease HI